MTLYVIDIAAEAPFLRTYGCNIALRMTLTETKQILVSIGGAWRKKENDKI